MSAITLLLTILSLFGVYFVVILVMAVSRARADGQAALPELRGLVTGSVANFFDTLGVGSFAPTTSVFRAFKLVRDEQIPGTLNVGYASAALFQSFIFIKAVRVDATTLISMIAAAVAGAWVGAGLFAKAPRRRIQIGMGGALLVAGVLFVYKNMYGDPVGGLATGLSGARLAFGLIGNFILGVLMTIGVGLYGPCMLLITLLGMNPATAFPIMMGSCAFLMPIASTRFLRDGAVNLPAATALSISALPGVYLAWRFFASLDVAKVRWLVAFVVLYTGFALLRSATKGSDTSVASVP